MMVERDDVVAGLNCGAVWFGALSESDPTAVVHIGHTWFYFGGELADLTDFISFMREVGIDGAVDLATNMLNDMLEDIDETTGHEMEYVVETLARCRMIERSREIGLRHDPLTREMPIMQEETMGVRIMNIGDTMRGVGQ